jgi:hypothetical protein
MALDSLRPTGECHRASLRGHVYQVLGELKKQLPECSYRIFYMHWIEGRAMPEIAAFLNLSIEQAWAQHHCAKQKFQCLFSEQVSAA